MGSFPAYLPVDSSDDSSAHIHASDKTVLKLMVEYEGLQQGREEHKAGQRVPPPIRNIFFFNEQDQHPGKIKKRNNLIKAHEAEITKSVNSCVSPPSSIHADTHCKMLVSFSAL